MDCFSYDQLIDWAENWPARPEQSAAHDHMAACRQCRQELDLLREMIVLMRSDKSRDVPRESLQAARDLFGTLAKDAALHKIKRTVIALLAFDSFRQPAWVGVRNSKSLGKQLLFKAEGYDIDLRFSPTERSEFAGLVGQVLQEKTAEGVAHAIVSLSTEGQELLATTTDTLGIFSFRNLPNPRTYDVKVVVDDMEITIENVSPL